MENQVIEMAMNQVNELLRKGFTPNEAFHKIGLLEEGNDFTESESKIVLSLFQLGEFVDSVKTKEQYEEHKEEIDAIYEFLSSKEVKDFFFEEIEENGEIKMKDKIWNEEELEEKTEYWHTHPEIGCTLREYLGMTKKEYEAYVKGELPIESFENSNGMEM